MTPRLHHHRLQEQPLRHTLHHLQAMQHPLQDMQHHRQREVSQMLYSYLHIFLTWYRSTPTQASPAQVVLLLRLRLGLSTPTSSIRPPRGATPRPPARARA